MEMVFDSSTIILLAKIEIIRSIAEDIEVIIPETVKIECLIKDTFDSRLISSAIDEDKIKVLKVGRQENVTRLCKDFKIHIGEAEALSLALTRKIPLAVDDLPAIKACKILNHSFTTAIHFLINIAKSKKINKDTAIVKLEKLSFYGRYSKRIIDDALKRIRGGV